MAGRYWYCCPTVHIRGGADLDASVCVACVVSTRGAKRVFKRERNVGGKLRRRRPGSPRQLRATGRNEGGSRPRERSPSSRGEARRRNRPAFGTRVAKKGPRSRALECQTPPLPAENGLKCEARAGQHTPSQALAGEETSGSPPVDAGPEPTYIRAAEGELLVLRRHFSPTWIDQLDHLEADIMSSTTPQLQVLPVRSSDLFQ
ncbi:hypothetical protein AGIG_G25345 [Arapaima gigas]